MTDATSTVRRAHLLAAFVVGAIALVTAGGVVFAHTDFDSSLPTDGAVVEGPLSEVVVNFTNPATPAGEGFGRACMAAVNASPRWTPALDEDGEAVASRPAPFDCRWRQR